MSYILTVPEINCWKCGTRLKHTEDWLTDGGNKIICNACYLDTYFSDFKEFQKDGHSWSFSQCEIMDADFHAPLLD